MKVEEIQIGFFQQGGCFDIIRRSDLRDEESHCDQRSRVVDEFLPSFEQLRDNAVADHLNLFNSSLCRRCLSLFRPSHSLEKEAVHE